MRPTTEEELVQTVTRALVWASFDVVAQYSPKEGIEVDIMATRSGLVLLIECKMDSLALNADIGRLAIATKYLEKTVVPLAVKKFLVVADGIEIPRAAQDLAADCDIQIVLLKEDANTEEVLRKLDETESLRQLPSVSIDLLEEAKTGIASVGDRSVEQLLDDVIHWYRAGGKELARRELEFIVQSPPLQEGE
jgi:hypothetical protein